MRSSRDPSLADSRTGAVSELTEPATFAESFAVEAVLGPARLAYASRDTFRPAVDPDARKNVPDLLAPDHPDVTGLLSAVDPSDADESSIGDVTSPVFVERNAAGAVIAAAGYRIWPGATAHLSTLTAPTARGLGAAARVSSHAVAHALEQGLLPQWRARPVPSTRIARRLGFIQLGAQLSLKLAPMTASS